MPFGRALRQAGGPPQAKQKIMRQLGAQLRAKRSSRSGKRHAGRADLAARKSALDHASTGRDLGKGCTVSEAGITGWSKSMALLSSCNACKVLVATTAGECLMLSRS